MEEALDLSSDRLLNECIRLGLPSGLFPSGFPTKTAYEVHILGKYKQREEKQISEIGLNADKIRSGLAVSA